MPDQLSANIEYCRVIVAGTKNLLLYTHIPAAAATLLLSFFVYFKNRNSLLSRILFGIGLSFSAWVVLNLLIWLQFDSPQIVMAAWAPIEAIKVFVFFLCWYFTYTFVEGKDFSMGQKISWFLLLLITFGLSVTSFNLDSYNLPECIAIENGLFTQLTFWTEVFISALLVGYISFKLLRQSAAQNKKKLLFLGVGMVTFVLSFFILGKISEATQNYSYEAIGLFGMVIFTASMAYLILRYALFNIKIFATQLLVVALVILTGSQITFTTGYTIILAVITTVFSVVFGYFLVKSVRNEIKQRKQLEQLSIELERMNHSLETSNEKLKSLDKLKTEFISLVSHQIRTPLTAIKGYASLLTEDSYGKLTEPQENAVKRIYTSAQELTNMVEDFLNVSKIEQGGFKYEFMQVGLGAIVADLASEMKIPAESKGLELRVEIPDNDAFTVNADPTKIKQVFLNLVDNSIKYTKTGFVEIGIKREGSKVVFYVKDSGIGLTQETKEKLFQKFSRGTEGGKVNTGGSGLGLYLAKEIIVAHKGDITIDSDGPDKGTTFTVTLPALN